MGFRQRKQQRKEYYEKHIYGKKLIACTACSGSGYYDACDKEGEPIKCGCCEGTGKMRQ